MIGTFRNWWTIASVAERALMAVLGIAIAIVLLWLVVLAACHRRPRCGLGAARGGA